MQKEERKNDKHRGTNINKKKKIYSCGLSRNKKYGF
jgi:hypothetical protein